MMTLARTPIKGIGWKLKSLDYRRASTRYRALLPVLGLNKNHYRSYVFSDRNQSILNRIQVLVFVKTFSKNDFLYAVRAKEKGIKIILDLCDNIFINTYPPPSNQTYIFKLMSEISDSIVVSTEYLKTTLLKENISVPPITVIPDGVETFETIRLSQKSLCLYKKEQSIRLKKRQRQFYLNTYIKFKYWLSALSVSLSNQLHAQIKLTRSRLNRKRKRIVWFGIHGAEHADFGMLDLLLIQRDLERLTKEFNLELWVISNHRQKYYQHIDPFNLPTYYMDWSPPLLFSVLKVSDIVVIPSKQNDFSNSKSSNRAILALTAGVPVVASYKPVYKPLLNGMLFDNFYDNIKRYLSNTAIVKQHLTSSKKNIQEYYSHTVISQSWEVLFLKTLENVGHEHSGAIVVLIAIPQDLDLALPFIKGLNARNNNIITLCSAASLLSTPRIINKLRENHIRFGIISDKLRNNTAILNGKEKALVTFSESNANPHRLQHDLTRLANKLHIKTATIQHGFEHIGLSYTDNQFPIEEVEFCSDYIMIWGEKHTLHADIKKTTQQKCVPVGYLKSKSTVGYLKNRALFAHRQKRIGVFENLHWSRYNEGFRKHWIHCLHTVIRQYPHIHFIIKPHHQGKWLTHRSNLHYHFPNSVTIIDPSQPEWINHTAPELFPYLDAVISTPSTVVLDAAYHELPTAVFAYQLTLRKYLPLPHLESQADWSDFISNVLDPLRKQYFHSLSNTFIRQNISLGEPIPKILSILEE